jgi:hypothetical protein
MSTSEGLFLLLVMLPGGGGVAIFLPPEDCCCCTCWLFPFVFDAKEETVPGGILDMGLMLTLLKWFKVLDVAWFASTLAAPA